MFATEKEVPKEEDAVKHWWHRTPVVRMRRHKGYVVQDCDVYIGRECRRGGWDLPASKWANPYR